MEGTVTGAAEQLGFSNAALLAALRDTAAIVKSS
jgi:hypothetical protein